MESLIQLFLSDIQLNLVLFKQQFLLDHLKFELFDTLLTLLEVLFTIGQACFKSKETFLFELECFKFRVYLINLLLKLVLDIVKADVWLGPLEWCILAVAKADNWFFQIRLLQFGKQKSLISDKQLLLLI